MSSIAISLKKRLVLWQVDKLLYVFIAMFILPFAFHLIPVKSQIPLGAVWLPIFYAPLICLRKYRFHVAFASCLIAPTLNMLLTGMPSREMSIMLTFDLLMFVSLTKLFFKFNKKLWFMAPFIYAVTKLISSFVFHSTFMSSLKISYPGLIVLFIIGFALRNEG